MRLEPELGRVPLVGTWTTFKWLIFATHLPSVSLSFSSPVQLFLPSQAGLSPAAAHGFPTVGVSCPPPATDSSSQTRHLCLALAEVTQKWYYLTNHLCFIYTVYFFKAILSVIITSALKFLDSDVVAGSIQPDVLGCKDSKNTYF